MAVALTTLESNLQTKLNATSGTTDAQEFLLLSKSVEALTPSIAVQSVIDEGTTQVAAVTSAGTTQVGLVTTEGTTQVAAVNTAGTTQVAALQAAGSNYVTQADINTSVSALVDSAPGTLDTLNELAAALGDDANFSTTVTNSIATKLPLAGGTITGNVDFADGVAARFGASQDLSISHDGSNSYINELGTGSLVIQTNGDKIGLASSSPFEWMVEAETNGPVRLYYDGQTRLSTTSTGASVTGDLSVSGNVSGSYTNLHPEVTTANVSSSQTIDMTKPMHHFDMTAATAFSGVSIAAGRTSMMVLDTTATPHTPTWGSDIKWPGATEPTWADSRYWIVSMTCLDGSIILASASGYTV